MIRLKNMFVLIALSVLSTVTAVGQSGANQQPKRILIEAESGVFNPARMGVIEQKNFSGSKAVALKPGQTVDISKPAAAADIVYTFHVPVAGRYELLSTAATSEAAYCYAWVAIDDETPHYKVVVSPWRNLNSCKEHLSKANLTAGQHRVKIWLPDNVSLDCLELTPFRTPKIPDNAAKYIPALVPPQVHPRLMITPQTLTQVRQNLTVAENKEVWESVKKAAAIPYILKTETAKPNTKKEKPKKLRPQIIGIFEDEKALDAAVGKAFVYLMENDKAKGREAVKLMTEYIRKAEFGNQLDVCRKIGQLIYSAAVVYDWCYDITSPEEKRILRENMMRLAEDMEIGWPPFKQQVINGHGNEAQLSRDLLAMSIAIYNEDPLPYKLCSYRILEEVVPSHNKEYVSGRHNQGSSYGQYRFGWDMYAAWIFYRMTGKEIFSADLKKVPYFWLYMRTPDGELFHDGDVYSSGKYWGYAFNTFLDYTYGKDSLLKRELIRQEGTNWSKKINPVLYLLLNNPSLKMESSLERLPLTRYFSVPLSSMICRTGWTLGPDSPDAVVEMKGADTYFGNHQHLDAGAFQIYYRGMLAADLGIYHFYGTAYDINFNKRSVAHNLMLAFDPDEKLPGDIINDGGQKALKAYSPNGSTPAHDFGPYRQAPQFSYLKTDLTAAYSNKISSYVRSFCFINLGLENSPGALITFDRMITAKPEFTKYWQINSYLKPEITENGFVITGMRQENPGKLIVTPLLPESADREINTIGGNDANTIFGHKFQPPAALPEASGWRTVISPKTASREDLFLTVMQIAGEKAPPLKIELLSGPATLAVAVADRIVSFSRNADSIKSAFELKVPSTRKQYQVLFCDLTPGKWIIKAKSGQELLRAEVKADAGTLFAPLSPGEYQIAPAGNSSRN
jgi:heparin/heparan-sulfate lyase